jgi:tetratricopeptide (TPR) repeat protein
MILTQCAVCATPLPHPSKQCGICKTPYCGRDCQKLHWKGGHRALCPQIKRSGGAEQYNANQKYTEAVSVAAEACAEDTKGQTCYICTQALHWKTKEGLVRGCACRGTAGFAHVSCLAEQAKILVAECVENNLDAQAMQPRWDRWDNCGLCEQRYHGVVACALGWACWKTYLGRPETDFARIGAMNVLGTGLSQANQNEDALTVKEAELSMLLRVGAPAHSILVAQGNLAQCYSRLGRKEEALSMFEAVYSGHLKLSGEDRNTISAAMNYAISLFSLRRFEEAKALLHETMPVARRILGENDVDTLKMRSMHASALYQVADTLNDMREAVNTLEETVPTMRRLLGGAHPLVRVMEEDLRKARTALRARGGDVESVRQAMAAMTPGDA